MRTKTGRGDVGRVVSAGVRVWLAVMLAGALSVWGGVAAAAPPPFSFGTVTNYAVGNGPLAITLGDFNGDGKRDFVTANNLNANASVYFGVGDGTFINRLNINTGNFPTAVAVGDMNNDTFLDFVVVTAPLIGQGSVKVFLGDGIGGFTPGASFTVASTLTSIVVADFNGDGKRDIAAVSSVTSGAVYIYLNDPVNPGTFAPATFPSYTVGNTPRTVVVGDFNGDMKADLAVTNSGNSMAVPGNSVSLLFGNGDGTFAAAPPIAVGNSPYGIAVGDLNGDTKQDLVVTNSGNSMAVPGNNVSVLLGDGMGVFAAAMGSPVTVGTRPQAVVIVDVNGDGKLDLAVANNLSGNLSVLLGNGDGTYAPQQVFPISILPAALVAADLNGDTKPELLVANAGGASVSVVLNTTVVPATITATQGTPQSVIVGATFGSLKATAKNGAMQPLPGVTLTFTTPATGASGIFAAGPGVSIDGHTATVTTDMSGIATAPALTAGTIAGSFAATAVVTPNATPSVATFALTVTPGPAANVAIVSGDGGTSLLNTGFPRPMVVRVADQYGNAVAGVNVTFAAPVSGASGIFPPSNGPSRTVPTDTNGIATAPGFMANGIAGMYSVTASTAGAATPATFTLTNGTLATVPRVPATGTAVVTPYVPGVPRASLAPGMNTPLPQPVRR